MLKEEQLDFWLENNLNVLFVGHYGIGKTAMVTDCAERAGLVLGETYLYFSGSTLDPWVDFIGIPKEKMGDDGVPYIDLVRPKALSHGTVEFIFIDELNRSAKKIRNAVLELIQFKRLNGLAFPNLRAVWAAINPEEDDMLEYDVEKLDPAQKDRFHIIVDVPYQPSLDYFTSKFGADTAKSAIAWWEELPQEKKLKVSPRRLEYALDYMNLGGSPRDVLPHDANVAKFVETLEKGPIADRVKALLVSLNEDEARAFLNDENNFTSAARHLSRTVVSMNFFLPLLNQEKLSILIGRDKKVLNHCVKMMDEVPVFKQTIELIVEANQNKKIVRQIGNAQARKLAGKQPKVVPSQSLSGVAQGHGRDKFGAKLGGVPATINAALFNATSPLTVADIASVTSFSESRIEAHLKHHEKEGRFVKDNHGRWSVAPGM